MFRKILIYTIVLSCFYVVAADVKSVEGRIRFDVNLDGQSEAVLDENGFALGVNQATANLYVSGNAMISQQLAVGGVTADANLRVYGTYGYGFATLSNNTTVTNQPSVLFLDASLGDFQVILPNAEEVSGRQYTFKKQQALNKVLIFGGGNIEGKAGVSLGAGVLTTPSIKLASDGAQWNILEASEIDGVLDANLMAWWNFDETKGVVANNAVSSQYSGTLTNGLSFSGNSVTGISGGALSFDGIDDVVITGDIDMPSSNLFSVSVWIKTNREQLSNGSGYVVSKDQYVGSSPYNIWVQMGTNYVRSTTQGTSTNNGVSIKDNSWHHVVITFNQTLMSLYVDGVFKNSATVVHTANDESFSIGSSEAGSNYRPYSGEIDEVKLFNKTLSLAEIMTLYNEFQ